MSAKRAAQLVEAGQWLQMSGDVDGARRLFEQALRLDPSNLRAKQLLEAITPAAPAPLPEVPEARSSPMALKPPTVPPIAPSRAPESERSNGAKAASLGPPAPGPQVLEAPSAPGGPGRQPLPERTPPPPADEVPIGLPPRVPVADSGDPVIRAVKFAPNATSAWDSQSNPGVHLKDVKPGLGDAMDLVANPVAAAPAAPERVPESDRLREEVQTLLRGARDLLELDDHSGAMELIVKAQALAPNDPEVLSLRERSEKTLLAMFESKLGPMTGRPRVVLKDDEIIWLNLDHRAGFVLAQIDGTVSFEDLFEVCGMSRLDTARILAQLVDEGVITTT